MEMSDGMKSIIGTTIVAGCASVGTLVVEHGVIPFGKKVFGKIFKKDAKPEEVKPEEVTEK